MPFRYEPNAGLYRQKFFNAVIYPLSIFYDRTRQDEAVPRKSDEQDLQIMDQLMDIMSCKFSDTPQYFFSSFGMALITCQRVTCLESFMIFSHFMGSTHVLATVDHIEGQ